MDANWQMAELDILPALKDGVFRDRLINHG